MEILVNGETEKVAAETTLAAIVEMRQLAGKRIAIEVNEAIVPRSEYPSYCLHEGDRVEIVGAVGGG